MRNFGWFFHFCKLRNKIYGRFTVSRSCKAFKTLVTLITFRWQVICWHFWKMSVGYSGSSRFLPMFSHPWATLIVEDCRSGFSYSLLKEWISSWKTQVTGKRVGGDEVSLLENGCWVHWRRWLLCQGKLHGQELLNMGETAKQRPFSSHPRKDSVLSEKWYLCLIRAQLILLFIFFDPLSHPP